MMFKSYSCHNVLMIEGYGMWEEGAALTRGEEGEGAGDLEDTEKRLGKCVC